MTRVELFEIEPLPTPLPRVLVVEREDEVAAPIVEQLAADGYRPRLARTAEHARQLAGDEPPNAGVLGELESPRAALELLAEIRSGRRDVWRVDLPVILCSAGTQEADVLRAFEAGTDDFLGRPPGYLELRARLRALLLRAGDCRARRVVGALELDLRARTVCLHGRLVALRRLEYELLAHLAGEPHRVFAKRELLRTVWGHQAQLHTRTLDTHASRLRRKLRAGGSEQWVVNVRGVGYRLI